MIRISMKTPQTVNKEVKHNSPSTTQIVMWKKKKKEPAKNNATVCTMCASMTENKTTLRMQKLCIFRFFVSNDSFLHASNNAEWRYHTSCTKRSNRAHLSTVLQEVSYLFPLVRQGHCQGFLLLLCGFGGSFELLLFLPPCIDLPQGLSWIPAGHKPHPPRVWKRSCRKLLPILRCDKPPPYPYQVIPAHPAQVSLSL